MEEKKTEVFDPTEGMDYEFDPTEGMGSTLDSSEEEEDSDLLAPPQENAPKRTFKQVQRATEKTKKSKFFDDDLLVAKPRQTLAYEAEIDPLGLFVEQTTMAECLFDMIVNGKKMSSQNLRNSVKQTRAPVREQALLDDKQVEGLMNELGYQDKGTEEEMLQYLKDILTLITTGDEKFDLEQIDRYAKQIAAQKNLSEELAKEQLIAMRNQVYDDVQINEKTREEAVNTLQMKIFKGGILAVEAIHVYLHSTELIHELGHAVTVAHSGARGVAMVAVGGLVAPAALVFSGLIFVAETGVHYRRYKKGKISKEEFTKLVAHGAVGTVGSLVGVTAGTALGFVAGSAVFPVVGSLIGAGIGAVGGFLAGKYVSLKILQLTECGIKRLRKGYIKVKPIEGQKKIQIRDSIQPVQDSIQPAIVEQKDK